MLINSPEMKLKSLCKKVVTWQFSINSKPSSKWWEKYHSVGNKIGALLSPANQQKAAYVHDHIIILKQYQVGKLGQLHSRQRYGLKINHICL